MNWDHLKTFLWLRWRLSVNQWRRAGKINGILMLAVAILLFILVIPLFFGSLAAGVFAFDEATPLHLLIVWDVLVGAFLMFWSIGLMAELQRSESLSLSQFLHLPISVNGAFIINYVSSLLRLSLIVFVPVLVGLAIGLGFSKGPLLWLALPAIVAFLLLITALTYQFQGWLATLMSNPRRRRTVVVVTTTVFVLIFQLPNLLRFAVPQSLKPQDNQQLIADLSKLEEEFRARTIDRVEFERRKQELVDSSNDAQLQTTQERFEQMTDTLRLVNWVLPLGWLPLGVMYAADGNPLPVLLGTLGMAAAGAACLWRAYRTTVRLYQGQPTSRRQAPARTPSAAAPVNAPRPLDSAHSNDAPRSTSQPAAIKTSLLEARLPGISEPAAAVALASFRSLLRALESKMMLLTPFILGAVFGSMVLREKDPADYVRALYGIGAIGMTLFGTLQLMANQFGFDRDGFRTFVLCSAPRRDILLGKNLAFAPLGLTMSAVLIVVLQIMLPLRWDHLLAMLPQFVAMYFLFCLLMNVLSIYAPMRIAAGTLKPTSNKAMAIPILLHLAMMMCLMPITMSFTLLPLGIEALAVWLGFPGRVPTCLVLCLVQAGVVILLYRLLLTWQGDLLRSREQRILDIVTNRAA